MQFLGWLLRVLFVLLVLRILIRLFRTMSGAARPSTSRQAPNSPERIGGALVRDPHCGTFISKARAVSSGRGADVQYFCSAECRDAWATAQQPVTASGRS